MIPENTDVVETSSNLAAINSFELNTDKVVIMAFNRSSDSKSLCELVQIQKNIGKLFSYEVNVSGPSPIWQPDFKCNLVNKAIDVYHQILGDSCNATVIHAGLECGYIADYFKNKIECISIGPTIVNPHTGGERLNAETVVPFYNAVSKLIQVKTDNSQKIEEIKNAEAKPIEPNPNTSFTSINEGNKGLLLYGKIIPCINSDPKNPVKYSIIVDGKPGTDGKIPYIRDIWVQQDQNFVWYRYSIHALGGAPARKNLHLKFTDEEGDTYNLLVCADDEHTVNYNSKGPNIIRIEWYISN